MSLRVGVIGAGAMGADHIRTIASSVPSARVSAVYDFNRDTAYAAAAPVGADVVGSAEELIESSGVDAVIIASPDRTHAELVRICLAAGKQVLCEKPLAVTADEAYGLVEAEAAGGQRLLQVGFMRRFDPGFVALRRTITDGVVGDVRLVHAIHRNASSSTSTDDAGLITGSMIHELDTVAWLLDDEVASIRVESPIVEGFRDPQLATIWMRGGAMISAEVFVNAGYGYDVRCEVVGSKGTAALSPSAPVSTRVAGVDGVPVRDDFVAHFADAYRIELSTWAGEALTGSTTGPSAWDGYVANAVAEAGVLSLSSGAREPVTLRERPALYA
ncbi:Gfo/Idh/MocA family oxidoreductase [Aeromicrobium chenweiae]|uniref:Gfo/Idh/MocA family oxidoreductase n=1 Tax=Aeromicrobium chenweiae TaxID=2079793 RepID=UPI001091C90F|nr:Gfo/Idh/MocA family oxidoreductase [Aeromicrobium chenweiae]TGN32533.1 inositol 2-dehydrogenase [Aeromicrobium chenweiae]